MNTSEFMEAAGLSRHTVKNWQDRGYLIPDNAEDGQVGAGKGNPLHWSPSEVVVARAMRLLVDAGLTLPVAADAARLVGTRKRSTVTLTDNVTVTVYQ